MSLFWNFQGFTEQKTNAVLMKIYFFIVPQITYFSINVKLA